MAIAVLLAAVTASGALAKGKPTRVEITQAACGSFTVGASWWKRLDVQSVRASYGINSSTQGLVTFADAAGFASPWSYSFERLGISTPSTTYNVTVSLYADTNSQVLLDSGTATVTLACSFG